jgi:hypothetical protein
MRSSAPRGIYLSWTFNARRRLSCECIWALRSFDGEFGCLHCCLELVKHLPYPLLHYILKNNGHRIEILCLSFFLESFKWPFANFRDPAWTFVLKKTRCERSRHLAQCTDGVWWEREVIGGWICTRDPGGRLFRDIPNDSTCLCCF